MPTVVEDIPTFTVFGVHDGGRIVEDALQPLLGFSSFGVRMAVFNLTGGAGRPQ
jgi:hypothetical protein